MYSLRFQVSNDNSDTDESYVPLAELTIVGRPSESTIRAIARAMASDTSQGTRYIRVLGEHPTDVFYTVASGAYKEGKRLKS